MMYRHLCMSTAEIIDLFNRRMKCSRIEIKLCRIWASQFGYVFTQNHAISCSLIGKIEDELAVGE